MKQGIFQRMYLLLDVKYYGSYTRPVYWNGKHGEASSMGK